MSESSAPADCPSGHADTVRLLSVFASAGASVGAIGAFGCCTTDRWLRRRLRLRSLRLADMSRLLSWPQSVRLYLVSFLIVGMSLSVLGPALTELRERSGADLGDIGVLFAGQSAGYIIGSFARRPPVRPLRRSPRVRRLARAARDRAGHGAGRSTTSRACSSTFVVIGRRRRRSPTSGQHDADVGARRRFGQGDEHCSTSASASARWQRRSWCTSVSTSPLERRRLACMLLAVWAIR